MCPGTSYTHPSSHHIYLMLPGITSLIFSPHFFKCFSVKHLLMWVSHVFDVSRCSIHSSSHHIYLMLSGTTSLILSPHLLDGSRATFTVLPTTYVSYFQVQHQSSWYYIYLMFPGTTLLVFQKYVFDASRYNIPHLPHHIYLMFSGTTSIYRPTSFVWHFQVLYSITHLPTTFIPRFPEQHPLIFLPHLFHVSRYITYHPITFIWCP